MHISCDRRHPSAFTTTLTRTLRLVPQSHGYLMKANWDFVLRSLEMGISAVTTWLFVTETRPRSDETLVDL